MVEAAVLSGLFEVLGFLDDGVFQSGQTFGYSVLGNVDSVASFRGGADCVIVAIGNNSLRESITAEVELAQIEIASVVHPRAFVSPTADVGDVSAIMAGAILGPEAKLGKSVIVNAGAVVDHHAQIHDFGHVGVNACMAGGSVLGYAAFMQAGAALGYGVVVGAKGNLAPGEAVNRS